jgi:hypothetical protein
MQHVVLATPPGQLFRVLYEPSFLISDVLVAVIDQEKGQKEGGILHTR